MLGFLAISFNWELAVTYVILVVTDKWIYEKQSKGYPISSAVSNSMWAIEAIATLGLFLIFSTFLVSTVAPQLLFSGGGFIEGAQSIFQLLSASTPILKDNTVLTFLSWAIFVPIIETVLFNGRLLGFFMNKFKGVTKNDLEVKGLAIFTVAATFTLFHLTSKGLDSTVLLITFVFSIMSSLLVIRHKNLKGAILLHCLTNSAAVLSQFGWGPFA